MSKEPLARGVVVTPPGARRPELPALAKECASILRALDAESALASAVPPEADFVLLLLDEAGAGALPLPELSNRAGSAIAVAAEPGEARVQLAAARKALRLKGAALGARELVFSPADFGYLGLETDNRRERLEILLRALVLDAERLRLRREGWEEPEA